jgi:RNA polymerase sigma-70 factor, ECF subfamily
MRVLQDSNIAQDIFQDTFLRLLRHAEAKEPVSNLPAFLLRIARNLSLNVKRDIARKPQVGIAPEHESAEQLAETVLSEREISDLVLKSIELLPEHQQEALMLQTYGGLSYEEIGAVMNVPVTTVRNWIVRGKERLRKAITPYLREPRDSKGSYSTTLHHQQP